MLICFWLIDYLRVILNSLNPQSHTVGQSSSSSSSSSSVQLPQTPALSSFADRRSQLIAFDRMSGSLFFYPTEPENILLSRLFSLQDLQLLFNLFHEYKVGDDLAWIDLLGLRCYDLLKQIEEIFGHENMLTGKWCPVYLLGYVSLFYKPEGGLVKDEKFFITPVSFAKQRNEISNLFDKGFVGMLLTLRLSGQEMLRQRVEALMQDWKKASILFGKFLMLPRPKMGLFTETISGCLGSEKLIPVSKDERKKAVDQLILLMELHKKAIEFGNKNGTITLSAACPELIEKMHGVRACGINSSEEELLAGRDHFFEELFRWKEELHMANSENEKDWRKATSGELTHKKWRAREGIVSSDKLFSQAHFIERTAQSVLLGKVFLAFACDYQAIFENCILQDADHNSVARANRFKHVASSILELSFEGEPDLLEMRNRFKEKLQEALSLSYIKKFLDVAEADHMTLLGFEFRGSHEACLKLQEEVDAFLARVDCEKMKTLSLSQTELNFWAQAFVLLHDLKILTKSVPISHLESEIFPNQFLELFESKEEEQYFRGEEEKLSLPNLEELPSITLLNLSSSSASQSEKIEEQADSKQIASGPSSLAPSPSMISRSVENVKQAQSISKNARKKQKKDKEKTKEILAERKSRKVEQMLQELETSPSIPEKLKEILEEKKRIKVERILREMGLEPLPTKRRGKGGHKVWSDPQSQWGQTVIPEHDELKEGTRHAIVAQLMNRKDS